MKQAPQVYCLRSRELAVTLLPANGGKIASIKSLPVGTEFLLSGARPERVADYPLDAGFEESDCAGWDECLPSVSASGAETPGGAVPDHGDFWRLPWTVLSASANQLTLRADGLSRPLRFTRSFAVSEAELRIAYAVENIGNTAMPYLYAAHPLFAVDAGDRILLPREVHGLRLHDSLNARLKAPVGWPQTEAAGSAIALDTVGAASDGTAEMLYTPRLRRGFCGLYRKRAQQGLTVSFPVEWLPYLGMWLCCGGWPEAGEKQYAVALEPTVAPCGSLAQAIREGLAPVLDAGEVRTFLLKVQLTRPGTSYEQFRLQF